MNDDIVSLPNGDFYVNRKKSIREHFLELASKAETQRTVNLNPDKTYFGNEIKSGDRILYCFVSTGPIITNKENQTFHENIQMACFIESEIDYLEKNYEWEPLRKPIDKPIEYLMAFVSITKKESNGIDRDTLNRIDPINPEFFDAIKNVNPSDLDWEPYTGPLSE